jgi:hypothetical protein
MWWEKSINPCNASMFFLLELASCDTYDSKLRWLIVIPIFFGWVFTYVRSKEVSHRKPLQKENRLEVAYTILCHSVLIAGIASPLEAEFESWGYMTTIPCLVLMMMKVKKISSHLQWFIYILAFILVFLGHTVDNYRPPAEACNGHGAWILFITSVTLISTPVFGRTCDTGVSGWKYIPIYWSRWISSVVWYILIYCSGWIKSVPSLATWMAIPMLMTSAMTFVNSFGEDHDQQHKFVYATASVLLGLGVSGNGAFQWWTKFCLIAIIGITRCV